jgi:3D (Asp-Asp-Asp) domain-containing protein
MPQLDSGTSAALDAETIHDVWFAYLNVEDDVIRVTTAGYDVTLTGTGDPDLDGHTFLAVDPSVIDIGEVVHRDGGSETVTARLSGILEFDSETLNAIGDRSRWQGRDARLWLGLRDETGAFAGALVPYYTGYMMTVELMPSAEGQTIELGIENYLALMSAASNRTYLNQGHYDAADQSARATIGAANGAGTGPGAGVAPGPAAPGGPRYRYDEPMDAR